MGTQIAYKVLFDDGRSFHGGKGSWPLPKGNKPGKWVEHEGRLIACRSGLHLCRKVDLTRWFGPAIFEAEYDDSEVIDAGDKIVVRRARLTRKLNWNDRTARLFAADCAARALRMEIKAGRTIDPRSKAAIKTARAFAEGKATEADLSAAESAARSAARSAAESAARSAAWSAAESAAWSAARSAAESAVRSAAWSAAESAAWSAAESWQTKRLFEKYLDV